MAVKKAKENKKEATAPKTKPVKRTSPAKVTPKKKTKVGQGKRTTSKGGRVYTPVCAGSGDKLMLVESPNKVKSITQYLGAGWRVMATFGHCFQMPTGGIPINTDDWTASFIVEPSKKDIVKAIEKEAKKSTEVYLATDPDREGEAIAWFVFDAISPATPKTKYYRVTFNAITKTAITQALQAKSSINMDMVYAQRARSFVDRLVGYKVSSLLTKNVLHSHRLFQAAGRVKSVAMRFLVERQREIEAFTAEEFWEIFVNAASQDGDIIKMELSQYKGKTIKVTSETEANKITGELKGKSGAITGIKEKDLTLNPKPPFTTSTLLQAASTQLGYSTDKTMSVAQQLFEQAFISYHRTDSVRLEPDQVTAAMTVLKDQFGPKYVAKAPIQYKSKSRSKVQDAHTAITPTHPENASIAGTPEQQKLYDLIRKRFLACQSTPSLRKSRVITALFDDYEFRAQGSTLVFDGFKKILGQDEDDEETVELPNLSPKEKLTVKKAEGKQKFTQPPAYFNDASLIKAMEAEGVGRPSTYASSINDIIERKYVQKDGKKLVVTQDGYNAMDYLLANFNDIFHPKFTSTMETGLDEIEDARRDWKDYLTEFWSKFEPQILAKDVSVLQETNNLCPICKTTVKKYPGRFGPTYSCEGKTKGCPARFDKNTGDYLTVAGACPKCGKDVIKRNGRNGAFLGCTGYPHCKTICACDENGNPILDEKGRLTEQSGFAGGKTTPTAKNVVGQCTECGKDVVERQGRYGPFYSCSGYPECKTIFTLNQDGSLTKKK